MNLLLMLKLYIKLYLLPVMSLRLFGGGGGVGGFAAKIML